MTTITFHNVLPQVFQSQSVGWGGDAPAPEGSQQNGASPCLQGGAVETGESSIWQRIVSFSRGHNYLIEAESGRGKSTFCSYVMGYRHDYSGKVLFDGSDASLYSISQWSELRRCHVSCLFQELRLFPELTAFENVEIKNKITHHKTRKQLEQWFHRLGIADKLHVKVGRLSFGQQQRVALMRALAQPFDFLLADEPVSHLDDRHALTVASLVAEEAAAQGAAVIVTSIGKRLPLNYHQTLLL